VSANKKSGTNVPDFSALLFMMVAIGPT